MQPIKQASQLKINIYSCKDNLELPLVTKPLGSKQEWVYHNIIITDISSSNDLPNTMSAKLKITHSDLDSDTQSPFSHCQHQKTNYYQYDSFKPKKIISSKLNALVGPS